MGWEGEFVEQLRSSSVDHHFLYSYDLIMLDLGLILKGEIRYYSLSRIKVLITVYIFYVPRICW